ncbi:MAG: deoxyribose-phosphate aldolase [Lachnospiraceae bacterium]|nr:deoxyribose-phosphate aldolase [Lachnospiraceae bacterium]
MLPDEAAAMIDISTVRTQHTLSDIREAVEYARKYRFINVHTLPCWTAVLSEMLKDVEGVYAGAPVGFPGGAHKTEVKLLEAGELLKDGVQEMDIVMNIGKLKNGEYDYVLEELKEIIALAKGKALVKVIIEINTLTDEEMLKACDLVMESGADFIKTGTGWVPGDANIERIRKIKEHCGDRIRIKAAGGIRTLDDFMKLAEMGVERMGINMKSAVEIVQALAEK